MHRRGLRLAVVVAFVAALAGTAYFLYAEHQRTLSTQAQAKEFDLAHDRAVAAVTDVRVSLQAALVPGQGDNYWLPRAATSLDAASAEIGKMKQRAVDGAALNDLDAAVASLEQVTTLKAEITRYLAGDMRTQAGRLMFSDGVEALTNATERIESARWTALSQREADEAGSESLRAIVAGGLAALALIVIGLLLPSIEQDASAGTDATPARVTEADSAEHESLGHAAVEIGTSPVATALPQPASTAAGRPAEPTSADTVLEDGAMQPVRDRRKAPELRAAADLCTDFARLVDGQEMPSLLERASKLLDSTGFIVWLADQDGRQLRPSLAHGYPAQTLAKLPLIPRHADNATAAAFRHAEMQIVRTNGMSPGAIVVPILGPAGCVGVMAAEVRHGREASESARALARIVAAQLATLVSVTSAQAEPLPIPAEDGARQVG